MARKNVLRDVLYVLGVQVLAIGGMMLAALLLLPVCILLGIDHPDSMAAAAGGALAVSMVLLWRVKKRCPDVRGLFSLPHVLRRWGCAAILFGSYLLRCLLYSFFGGSLTIELPTQTLTGHLMMIAAYVLMNALALDALGAAHLQNKGYSKHVTAMVFAVMAFVYAAIDGVFRMAGGFAPMNLMRMLIFGLEHAAMTLLFLSMGSLWGRMLFTGMTMLIMPEAQAYSPLLFIVDLFFVLCLFAILCRLAGAVHFFRSEKGEDAPVSVCSRMKCLTKDKRAE